MMLKSTTYCGVIIAALMLAGCTTPRVDADPSGPGTSASPGTAPAVPTPVGLASMKTYQYLRIDAERTGIANVADDGRYTYVAFDRPVPEDLAFFDGDGQPIASARAGSVVALPGIYKGILARSGAANSFVTPNPRAAANDRPPLESDPDVVAARTRLELTSTAMPAFRQAMQKADETQRTTGSVGRTDGRSAGGGFAAPTPAPAQPATSRATSSYQVPPMPELRPVALNDPTYQVVPEGVMVRVFFASGGRAIVRPDDGMQRLEAEAVAAREIRIAGFTDAIGSESQNALLARQRSEAIRDLLIRRGVPQERLLLSWAGAGRYLADNETALGRALNRRVEVLFLK